MASRPLLVHNASRNVLPGHRPSPTLAPYPLDTWVTVMFEAAIYRIFEDGQDTPLDILSKLGACSCRCIHSPVGNFVRAAIEPLSLFSPSTPYHARCCLTDYPDQSRSALYHLPFRAGEHPSPSSPPRPGRLHAHARARARALGVRQLLLPSRRHLLPLFVSHPLSPTPQAASLARNCPGPCGLSPAMLEVRKSLSPPQSTCALARLGPKLHPGNASYSAAGAAPNVRTGSGSDPKVRLRIGAEK